jgi:hypothetical protein
MPDMLKFLISNKRGFILITILSLLLFFAFFEPVTAQWGDDSGGDNDDDWITDDDDLIDDDWITDDDDLIDDDWITDDDIGGDDDWITDDDIIDDDIGGGGDVNLSIYNAMVVALTDVFMNMGFDNMILDVESMLDISQIFTGWIEDTFGDVQCFMLYISYLPLLIPIYGIIGSLIMFAYLSGWVAQAMADIAWLTITVAPSLGVIPGGGAVVADVVEYGWDFTRPLANMFLILALVIIGLGIILKIGDYEAKKALPRFLLVAVLINFAPVIVGFPVDMSNIVMKFFIEGAAGIEVMPLSENFSQDAINGMKERSTCIRNLDDLWVFLYELAEILCEGTIIFIFFLKAAFVYWLVATLFLLRTAMLWLLMVLSPIAFLSYAFVPSTVTANLFPNILGWKKWWEELIGWSLVGILFCFFLYLSNATIVTFGMTLDLTDLASERYAEYLEGALAYFFGLMILFVGYKISKDAAPQMAKQLINNMEKIPKMIVSAVKMLITKGAMKGMGGIGGKIGGAFKSEPPKEFGKDEAFSPERRASWVGGRKKRGLATAGALKEDQIEEMWQADPKSRDTMIRAAKANPRDPAARKIINAAGSGEFTKSEIAAAFRYSDNDIEKETKKLENGGIFENLGITGKENKENLAARVLYQEKTIKDAGKIPTDLEEARIAMLYRGGGFWNNAHKKLKSDNFRKLTEESGGLNTLKPEQLARINPELVRATKTNTAFGNIYRYSAQIEDGFIKKMDEETKKERGETAVGWGGGAGDAAEKKAYEERLKRTAAETREPKLKTREGKEKLIKEISELRKELEKEPSPKEEREDLKRKAIEEMRRDVEFYKKAKMEKEEIEKTMEKEKKEAEKIKREQKKKRGKLEK